ncbi:MAG: Uncharacterized protein G01um101418_255 [Parcubacteria group bacterium Gr01-1014_18]|nr:MAG: Uncharacterized protein Greene041636_222 [Parcubacteria group bacterium Greene0416_36]TSC81273.1 MAG: Uncharacterized protein G01um101418_255 [Parcubacteria group bacterium Gr01-1014_18]TSC99295.1 MAG: Uncharacterized protein Greene101420_223 [Parcubacteria group bacterium Greene1014_20]TSD06868.1 MAG: Uncharacterized protein Greene07142_602 [Parcubacteria group bacterium Greene0714_2]
MFPIRINKPYYHKFFIQRAGLVAIFVSARCLAKDKSVNNLDEDLRIEINNLQCREYGAVKKKQLFNIPASFNGSKLRGLKQTIIFILVLPKGENILNFFPKSTAILEDISICELSGQKQLNFNINERAEDGDRRPWVTFVLINLPLLSFSVDLALTRRFLDSDDVKIIVNSKIKNNFSSIKHFFWYLIGGNIFFKKGSDQSHERRFLVSFDENLDNGIHYLEFLADRMPKFDQITLNLGYNETEAGKRASNIIKTFSQIIIDIAREYRIDPVIVASVIYQEQSINVNFVDTLTDYVGGLAYLNTSVGIGQIRVKTAENLEKLYPELRPLVIDNNSVDSNILRVTRLLEPSLNIRFVAAKIKFSQERWKQSGFDISDKSDILGTLYNLEDIANPILPNEAPEANDFGLGVENNYQKVRKLLGYEN